MITPRLLVIVPCGQSKIWKNQPKRGPEKAKNAYTGAPFKVNKAFAEKFSSKPPDKWVILSAKYGFIEPEFEIENYNVTFKKPLTKPITFSELRQQFSEKALGDYDLVIALGGEDYTSKAKQVFGHQSKVIAPATGLRIGLGMSLIKELQKFSKEEMLKKITTIELRRLSSPWPKHITK
jgi:hypothetical protein